MNREEILQKLINSNSNRIALELPTGLGKTRLALEYLNQYKNYKMLIVEPRLVLIENFKQEMLKWNYNFENISFSTYSSLHKNADKGFDIIVYDEAHHFTENMYNKIKSFNKPKKVLLLSATLKRNNKETYTRCYGRFEYITSTLKNAVQDLVLVPPKIILIELELNKTDKDTLYTFKKSKTTNEYKVATSFNAAFDLRRNYKGSIYVRTTQYEAYKRTEKQFESYKRNNTVFMQKRLGLELLTMCAEFKTEFCKELNDVLKDERTLTFCSNIEQTEKIGNGINSKNKSSKELLERFNNGEINHISSCEMLNEGVNLKDCKIGIFARLNKSQLLQIQKIGRILRHKSPIVIIPYFKGTREESIVQDMIQVSGSENIIKMTNKNTLINSI